MIQGKRRDLGLGSYPLVSLAEAREAAADNRKVARAGGDPTARASDSIVPTFAEAADKVIEMHTPGWKNGGKTAMQWRASLRDYAMTRIGARRVSDITSAEVMSILLPIWSTKPVTASRSTHEQVGGSLVGRNPRRGRGRGQVPDGTRCPHSALVLGMLAPLRQRNDAIPIWFHHRERKARPT